MAQRLARLIHGIRDVALNLPHGLVLHELLGVKVFETCLAKTTFLAGLPVFLNSIKIETAVVATPGDVQAGDHAVRPLLRGEVAGRQRFRKQTNGTSVRAVLSPGGDGTHLLTENLVEVAVTLQRLVVSIPEMVFILNSQTYHLFLAQERVTRVSSCNHLTTVGILQERRQLG